MMANSSSTVCLLLTYMTNVVIGQKTCLI